VRGEVLRSLERYTWLVNISIDKDIIRVKPLFSDAVEFVAMSNRLARQSDQPASSLAFLGKAEGRMQL